MWVSTKAQYGMRALVEVGLGGDEPTSLKTVADRQELSHQYLEQIFAVLRRAGIVESVRGARGGYRVSRPLSDVSALEIVELLEGSVAPVPCIDDHQACHRMGRCSTETLWRELDTAVRNVLGATSLADLVAQRQFLQREPLPKVLESAR